ncbi:FAD-binding protein [archaeon]|nr:FAD-binding protein [archaeon]
MLKTNCLVAGSGLAAYFAKKAFGGKALVVSKSFHSNSLASGKCFRTEGINSESLFDSMLETGRFLNEREKLSVFCNSVGRLKNLIEFKKKKAWSGGFACNVGFLRNFQEAVVNAELVKILVENSRIAGAVLKFKNRFETVNCKSLVLCTGGYSHLLKPHDSVNYGKPAVALAFEAGALLKDLEFSLFHPFGNSSGKCIPTEALQNAQIIAGNGKRLEWVENALREKNAHNVLSKISAAIANNGGCIKAVQNASIKKLQPISHYSLGGLVTGIGCSTSIEGVFAAGEAASGLHGADRIGGTALSEAVIFGSIAGKSAREFAKNAAFLQVPEKSTVKAENNNGLLSKHFKILNSKESLKEGLENAELVSDFFSMALFKAALKRKESRGSFNRTDFPRERKSFEKSFAFKLSESGKIIKCKCLS